MSSSVLQWSVCVLLELFCTAELSKQLTFYHKWIGKSGPHIKKRSWTCCELVRQNDQELGEGLSCKYMLEMCENRTPHMSGVADPAPEHVLGQCVWARALWGAGAPQMRDFCSMVAVTVTEIDCGIVYIKDKTSFFRKISSFISDSYHSMERLNFHLHVVPLPSGFAQFCSGCL